MKFACIGQDIPTLLPSLLTDLLFAGHEGAVLAVEEKNGAMQDVLQRYGDAVYARANVGGQMLVSGNREEVLTGADCVIYAGDVMAGSRFRMDREALSGTDTENRDGDEDPFSLVDQARVNGGIGGLLHTLRQGVAVYELCDQMKQYCPDAIIISMGLPVARTTAMFLHRGFKAFGFGLSPRKGVSGLEGMAKKLNRKVENVTGDVTGLPGFAFLIGMRNHLGGDILSDLLPMVEKGSLGRLSQRWLKQFGAVAVGDIPGHAEWLPAEEDFVPEKNPELSETVERRKERILQMNTVAERGLEDNEAKMAQLLLLSKAPACRPVQLALAVLKKQDLEMHSVIRQNNGELKQLPRAAVIESDLVMKQGEAVPHGWTLPASLADICLDIDLTNRLAAEAATGDRSALRECIETDPALAGLDRLYIQEVVHRMAQMHSDIIPWAQAEDDEMDEDDYYSY